jgi:hypothetical protein
MMIAATRAGSTSALKRCSIAASECSGVTPWNAMGNGTWKTSGNMGPKPTLYGCTFPVSAMHASVRPWNPPVNAITALRFVA